MAITVHGPLKIVAFNANGIGRRTYEARIKLQDKNKRGLFLRDTQNPHMRLCYYRQLVVQSICLVLFRYQTPSGAQNKNCLLSDSCGFTDVSALYDERTGLSFAIAGGPRQCSSFWVWVPRDSWPYFSVSHLRLAQLGRPDPCIYIPQAQVGPVTPPGSGFPFRRLLRLAGLRWKCSNHCEVVSCQRYMFLVLICCNYNPKEQPSVPTL
jgi:hypothetical protein